MASLNFNNVYLNDYFSLGGPKEKDSKIGNFNLVMNDYYYGCKTFEKAEIKMQRTVLENILRINKLSDKMIDYLIGGDLLNQICATSYNARDFNIPYIGVYSACATFVLSLIHACMLIESKNADKVICITSSHSLTAERQFRFPIEYGNTKPMTATCTSTGAVSALVSKDKSNIKIISATVGKIVDLGIKDANHMGAAMAPACADTLYNHLKNNKETTKDYDIILTGDLGNVGLDILKEYYEMVYKEKLSNVMDASSSIYLESQNMYAGGSGPACLPLVLFCKILKSKRYKKILLVATGALHSLVMLNQKETIPGIAHAISIEVLQ